MFYKRYGSETFEVAKKKWLHKKGKANFIKMWWWKFSIENNGSLIMAEIKPIQEELIDRLIKMEYSSLN